VEVTLGNHGTQMHIYSGSCCFIMIRDMETYRQHPWITSSHRIEACPSQSSSVLHVNPKISVFSVVIQVMKHLGGRASCSDNTMILSWPSMRSETEQVHQLSSTVHLVPSLFGFLPKHSQINPLTGHANPS
jgi:hypothetical protein